MRTIVVGVIAVFGILAAHAEPPAAGPDWSSDTFLVGTWSCDVGRAGRSPARQRAVYSMDLGGRWLKLTSTLTADEPSAPSVTTDAYETFDTRLKKWVYLSVRSDGDYGMAFSAGWQGGMKIYGPEPESKDKWRLIATKVSDREFRQDVEITGPDGKLHRALSIQCKKAD
jgi:hypothetical protein